MQPVSTTPVAAGRRQPVPVVLAGARGHGHWHLANIRRLAGQGLVRLAGVCEPDALSAAELAAVCGPGGAPRAPGTPGVPEATGLREPLEQGPELGPLLDRTGARIAVICTPIHTHADLALTAAGRGVHLLLEKPPAPSYAEYRRLCAGVRSAGVHAQIGFQSLGSHAITAIRELIADGAIGRHRGIGCAGTWVRDEAYFTRAPWAGRRRLDGREVMDGVLTNPLAHAVATALRIDGSDRAEDVAEIETELFRAHEIEADDTSCVRVRTVRGSTVVAGVTLCAERTADPYVVVHGERGRIVFWYTRDRVRLERAGHPPETTEHPRTDLLADLVDRLTGGGADAGSGGAADSATGGAAGGAELLVPPERTGAFMRVVEAVRTAPGPRSLPPYAWRTERGERAPRRMVPGIDALVTRCADTLSLFSELDAPWARPQPEVPRP